MARRMKKRTYNNILRTSNMLMKLKGYDRDEANELALFIWDEFNPLGMPIEEMVNRTLSKSEYEAQL